MLWAEGTVLCASGKIEPAGEERDLRFPVPGRIAKLNVSEGSRVARGDVLAELENAEEKARCALSRAELEKARAALKRLVSGARREERVISAAKAACARSALEKLKNGARKETRDRARAAWEKCTAERRAAQRVLERLRKLREGEIEGATAEELERAEDAASAARAAEAGAKAAYDLACAAARREDLDIAGAKAEIEAQKAALVKKGARKEDLAAARAEVAAAEARKAIADARLEKTFLRSPVDGKVLEVFSRTGEGAGPAAGMPVMTVGDVSRLVIRAEVDEHDVASLSEGQRAYASASAFGSRKFHGTVVSVGLRMGRKRLFSSSPRERMDTRVLEALVELEKRPRLPVGFRMDVYFLGDER
jgi:HlyD family secretion protein